MEIKYLIKFFKMIKIVYNSSYLSIEMFWLPASRYEIVTNSIFACLTVKFSSETQLCRVISLNFFPIERKLQKLSNEETLSVVIQGSLVLTFTNILTKSDRNCTVVCHDALNIELKSKAF